VPRHSYEFAELDKELFSLLKKLGYAPTTIFDVGAAKGFWSHAIAEVFPHAAYHLFEPLIDHVPEYASSMEWNLALHPSFVLHKLALGEVTGETAINVLPESSSSTILDFDVGDLEVRRLRVPAMTLDDVVRERTLPAPQIVKIDVQGAELSVLKGAQSILPEIDVLLLECWICRGYDRKTPLLSEIMNWLADFGFMLWDLGDSHRDSYRDAEGVLTTVDCMFVNARTMAHCLTYRVEVPERRPSPELQELILAVDRLSAELVRDAREERERCLGEVQSARAEIDRLTTTTEQIVRDAREEREQLLGEIQSARAEVDRLTTTTEQVVRDAREERERLVGEIESVRTHADRLTAVTEQAVRDAREERERLLGEVQRARADVDRAAGENARLAWELNATQGEIQAMKSSKFWKLRMRWLAVKRALGMTHE
jgi:FkbM family methyltransferase